MICSVSSLPPEGRTRMAGYLYGAHQEKTFNEQSTGEKEDLGSADCWASYAVYKLLIDDIESTVLC